MCDLILGAEREKGEGREGRGKGGRQNGVKWGLV